MSGGRNRFQDKVVIITGSSSGIGRAAAIEFAKEGAIVVLHGRSSEKLDETEKCILQASVSVEIVEKILKVQGSMEDPSTAERIIDETIDKFGKIDVLINNAGANSLPGCNDLSDLKVLDFFYQVNFRSVVQLSQLALPHLAKTKGCVINVSSVASQRTTANAAFYGSFKAALDVWTKARAKTFGDLGVRMNCINPGPIDTDLFIRNCKSEAESNDRREQVHEWSKNATILKRTGTAQEMASVLMFLASTDASYITGTCILADGGTSALYPEVPWRAGQKSVHLEK